MSTRCSRRWGRIRWWFLFMAVGPREYRGGRVERFPVMGTIVDCRVRNDRGSVFTHRLGYPEPFLEGATADLAHALAYVERMRSRWNADGDRLGLMAVSSRGPSAGRSVEREAVRLCAASPRFYAFLGMQPSTLPMFIAKPAGRGSRLEPGDGSIHRGSARRERANHLGQSIPPENTASTC